MSGSAGARLRWLAAGSEALGLAAILALRIRSWGPWDALAQRALTGPDSGDWASNARAMIEGGALSPTRPPLYTWLTVAAVRFVHDIVFAGYLVNLVAALLAVLVAWALGRMCLTRLGALALAALVALSPELVQAQHHFGVDCSLQLAAVLAFAASMAALRGRCWRLLPLGLALGLVASAHFLGQPWAVGLAALVLLRPGGLLDRLFWVAFVVALGLGTMALLQLPYETVGVELVAEQFRTGLASSFDSPQMLRTGAQGLTEQLLSRLGPASVQAWPTHLSSLVSTGVPVWVILALLPLGVLRMALPAQANAPLSARRVLWLCCVLAPVVLLEMAMAPERYRLHMLPLILLALVAGLELLVLLPARLSRSVAALRWAWLPLGLLFALPLAWLAPGMLAAWSLPDSGAGQHDRRAGLVIAEHFPPGGKAFARSQELRFYAHQDVCFVDPCEVAPSGDRPSRACLAELVRACGRERDLPFVVDLCGSYGFADRPDLGDDLLDAWAATYGIELGVVSSAGRRTTIYRIPRSLLETVAAADAGAVPSTSPPHGEPDTRRRSPGPSSDDIEEKHP